MVWYYGVLWYIMIYYGLVLWYVMVYHDILWFIITVWWGAGLLELDVAQGVVWSSPNKGQVPLQLFV